MKDRLIQFLTTEQLSPAQFADMLGVQRSGVSHILSGRNKPGFDFIEKFLKRFPTANADWLITGRGKMYKEMQTPSLFVQESEIKVPVVENKLIQTDNELFIAPARPAETAAEVETISPPIIAPVGVSGKKVERIILLYDDHSFSDYRPE